MKRRRLQFGLATMLAIVTVVGVGPGGWALRQQREARRQMAAAASLRESGAEVYSRPNWLWTLLEPDSPGRVLGLAIRDDQATDADVACVADLHDLVWIDLDGTRISDDGLSCLAGLSKLERLRLDETDISDAGVVRLTKLSTLHTLNLTRTHITDAGLVRLADLPNLVTLDVAKTRITDAGVVELQRKLPNIQIGR